MEARKDTGKAGSGSVSEHYELRLKETLEEAKRHYESYIAIRDQYNSFLQGRINLMMETCLNGANIGNKSDPALSIKANKAKADAIQQMKVNLEAQQEMLE